MPILAPTHASSPVAPVIAPTSLVVADASWFTTENLFSELKRPGVETLLLKCIDYRNALERGWSPFTWHQPTHARGQHLWQRQLILPSGWMKTFPRLGMRPIASTVRAWRAQQSPSNRLVLVITYPHYLYLRDMLAPDLTIYFNIDDYAQYWPHRAGSVLKLEAQAVRESDLTICVSRERTTELQRLVPHQPDRVRYLPHGCPDTAIDDAPNETPGEPPLDLSVVAAPRLGYVGGLEARVDWTLLRRLCESLPQASLVLVGKVGKDRGAEWQQERARCLALPNVRVLGWKPQVDLLSYNRAFDVCLIPYRVDHPFNRVCNPTKIMDYMGAGRPIVATALPECALHAARIDVAQTHADFVARVRAILERGSNDGRAGLRHAYALQHSCARTAARFFEWLPRA